MKKSTSMFIKGAVLAFIALLMLIPLFMVENQIRDHWTLTGTPINIFIRQK